MYEESCTPGYDPGWTVIPPSERYAPVLTTPVERAAALSVGSNALLVMLKIGVGLQTGSIGILSEALHSGIDLLASAIAWYAVRASAIPADDDHHWGHGKLENMSGAIEAALIVVAGLFVGWEAIHHLLHPATAPETGPGLVVMGISCVTNLLVSAHLMRVAARYDSAALMADAHHLATDVLTGIGVIAGLVLVRVTHMAIFDALTAAGVAILICSIGWKVMRESARALLDESLPPEELVRIREVLDAHVPPLVDHHDLRTRKAGPVRHVEVHLSFPRDLLLVDAQAVSDRIEHQLRDVLGPCHVVTHLEAAPVTQAQVGHPPEPVHSDMGRANA